MSLDVHVFVGERPEITILDDEDDVSAAGAERWRELVWGGEAARSLGLKLLPQLAVDDLFAKAGDLDILEFDVRAVATNVKFVSKTSGVPEDIILERCEIIQRAIIRARRIPDGGVLIW